jgi:predicted RNA-binding protein with PUA-like domain
MVPSIGNQPAIWVYKSADAKATVVAAGYITDALQRGMKVGDIVLVFDTATPQFSIMGVLTLTANAANLGYVQNS